MTAREWINANFMLIYESGEGFGVCASNGEQAFIPRKEAEDAAARRSNDKVYCEALGCMVDASEVTAP